ncbi:MAG: hypothetical protein WD766_07585 [Gemmatimonadota bacterium]
MESTRCRDWRCVSVALAIAAAGSAAGAAQAQSADIGPAAAIHVAAAAHLAAPLPTVLDTLDFAYYRDRVEPILLRDRGGFGPSVSACVTCHVKSHTPMPLEPLNVRADGSVYWTEEQSRRNYAVLASLVTPGAPEQSRFLRQPLERDAGGSSFHVGGKFWTSTDDPEWQTIAEWVRRATADGTTLASVASVDFDFFRTCVQRIFVDKRPGKAECINCHSGGARNFARSIPDGRAYWNEEESRQNFGVLSRYIEPGFPMRSRFLTHPLHPDAGGDHFHGGGRRWDSQDDPEWRMLEAWVRGESPSCVL